MPTEIVEKAPGLAVSRAVVFTDNNSLKEAYQNLLDAASMPAVFVDSREGMDHAATDKGEGRAVFIIDVMPETADVRLLAGRIKDRNPGARVILVTERLKEHEAREMMWEGIDEVLLKPLEPGELMEAIRRVPVVSFSPKFQPDAGVFIERMDVSSRVQHLILIVCFVLLCLSGFPLLFPESHWFEDLFFFRSSASSFELRSGLHRVAAVGLMILSGYHVYYIIFTRRGRENFRHILPSKKDFWDFVGTIQYNLGRRTAPPEYPKFDVFEKMEYLGAFWGNFIMILTGMLLWRKDWTLSLAPLWVYDVVRVVHRYEAILALSFVAIWHMYCVHLKPGQFPMGKVFLNGSISLEEMKAHHRQWYRQYVREQLGVQSPKEK